MPSHKSVSNSPPPTANLHKPNQTHTFKTGSTKTPKVSLAKLKASQAPMPPTRSLRPRILDASAEATRKRLAALDDEIGIIDPAVDQEDEDDTDYLQSVPGRPGQFSTTFASVYGSAVFANGHYFIDCGEPRCLAPSLVMNSKWVELHATGTPHGKPRKPPVCHKVPWTALEMEMLDRERIKQLRYTDHFRRTVCWHRPNLGPGHNGCNAAGVKTQAHNVTKQELTAAGLIIDNVQATFTGLVWQ